MTKTLKIETSLSNTINAEAFKIALDKYKEESGIMLGGIDHKDPYDLTLNLSDVVCQHETLKVENRNLIGKTKILDTPKGKLIQYLMDKNFKFGFAPRMLKDEDGNYTIISIDLIRNLVE